MTIIQSIILGIVQGATEFLPISSSGHLVLTPYFFGWEIPPHQAFIFDVLVQVATLLAVCIYFWDDLKSILVALSTSIRRGRPFETEEAWLGWCLILASIPAGLFGLLFKGVFEQSFSNPKATAFLLLGTAGLLLVAERGGNSHRSLAKITWKDAFWIGCFQILSLFPGISRSGATISGGMTRNLSRISAARFSFLMSVPIMFAAGLIALIDLLQIPDLANLLPPLVTGFISAAIIGYLAIRWLLAFLSRHSLYVFALYCVLLSTITLITLP